LGHPETVDTVSGYRSRDDSFVKLSGEYRRAGSCKDSRQEHGVNPRPEIRETHDYRHPSYVYTDPKN